MNCPTCAYPMRDHGSDLYFCCACALWHHITQIPISDLRPRRLMPVLCPDRTAVHALDNTSDTEAKP